MHLQLTKDVPKSAVFLYGMEYTSQKLSNSQFRAKKH